MHERVLFEAKHDEVLQQINFATGKSGLPR